MKGKIMFLTSEKAKEWKAEKWKYTYTNFIPTNQLLCLSGDYIYVIKLLGPSQVISWKKVPKGYRLGIDRDKIIYKTKAKLIKIVPRKLRKKKQSPAKQDVK